jgi:hypothetical protein
MGDIIIDDFVFELLYKTNKTTTDFIVLTSKKTNETNETKKTKMVFYKSRSGLGMWHYSIIVQNSLFKADGEYITGTFVHMKLQQFINSNIEKLNFKQDFDKGDTPQLHPALTYEKCAPILFRDLQDVLQNRKKDVCKDLLCGDFNKLYTFIGPEGINLECGGIEKIPGIYRTKQKEIDEFIKTHDLNNLHKSENPLFEQDSLRNEESKDSNTNLQELQELQARYLLPYQYMMSIIYEYLKKYFKFEGTEQLYYTHEHSIITNTITTTISIDIYQCIIYSGFNIKYYYYYMKYNHTGTIYYAPLFITPKLSKINNYGMYDCYMRSSIYFCKIYEYYGQLYGGTRKSPETDYVFIGHLISEYTLLPPFNLGALYMEVDECKVWFVKPDKLSELLDKKGSDNILAEYIVTFGDKDKINFKHSKHSKHSISTTYSGDKPYDVTICGLLVKNLPNLRNGLRANMGKTILGNHPHIYCTFYQADPLINSDLNKVIFYKDINDFNMFLYTNCLSIDKQTILTLNDFKISNQPKNIGQNITHDYLGAGENIGDIPLNDTTTWLQLVNSIDNRRAINKTMNNTHPENLDLKIKEEAEAEANAKAEVRAAVAEKKAAQMGKKFNNPSKILLKQREERREELREILEKRNQNVKTTIQTRYNRLQERRAQKIAEATARAAARAAKAAARAAKAAAEKNEANTEAAEANAKAAALAQVQEAQAQAAEEAQTEVQEAQVPSPEQNSYITLTAFKSKVGKYSNDPYKSFNSKVKVKEEDINVYYIWVCRNPIKKTLPPIRVVVFSKTTSEPETYNTYNVYSSVTKICWYLELYNINFEQFWCTNTTSTSTFIKRVKKLYEKKPPKNRRGASLGAS